MFLFWVLVFVAIVWGVIYLIREQGSGKKEEENPYTIARVRYARGEISKEQLEEIISNLNRGTGQKE